MTRRNIGIVLMMLGIIVILLTMMVGCSSAQSAEDEAREAERRFAVHCDYEYIGNGRYTIVDRYTGVNYLLCFASGKVTMTMLVNSDGTPYVSEEEVQNGKNVSMPSGQGSEAVVK